MKWIDDFLKAMNTGLGNMDLGTLKPINYFEILLVYCKESTARRLKIIDKSKVFDLKILAQKMYSPSAIRVEIMCAMVEAKFAKTNKYNLMKLAKFYDSLLQAWCLKDPYAKNGYNVIHNKNEVRDFIENLNPANPLIARELGKLTNSCFHLSYGLYSDVDPQICYENFGPYDVSDEFGKGHILTIKQFQQMKPASIWGKKLADFSIRKIRVYCVYKDVDFSMDAMSHAIYNGDLINGLKYYAVDINGKLVNNINTIKNVAEKIGYKSIEMWRHLTSLDFETAKVKYLEQRCYNYFHICNLIGMDWRPTRDMLEAVKGKPLAKNFWPELKTKKDKHAFWKSLLDPRIETLPKSLYTFHH